MTEKPQTLEAWYTAFDADDLLWLGNYQQGRDTYTEERAQRKRARKRRDRRYFGEEAWFPHTRTTADYFQKKFDLPQFFQRDCFSRMARNPSVALTLVYP